MSVGGGDAGLPHVGEMLSSLDVAGRFRPVVSAGGPPQCELRTLWAPIARLLQVAPLARVRHCLHFSMTLWDRSVPDETILGLDPLEHSGLDHAETILGPDPLEHSGLDHAGPVGQHVAGVPVGPDETLLGLDPLEHSGLDRADPAGQHASCCWPCGPVLDAVPI